MRETLRGRVNRLANVLIVVLACTALLLVDKTGMFRSGQDTSGSYSGVTAYSGVQAVSLSRGEPVRLLVQNPAGRCGVQDGETVKEMYAGGMESFLLQALEGAESLKASGQEEWKQAVSESESWVCYDFLYNVRFTGQEENRDGEGRIFLLTLRGSQADSLFCYDEDTGEIRSARVTGDVRVPAIVRDASGEGGSFAFELAGMPEDIPCCMMVLEKPPVCPVYTVSNPLGGEQVEERMMELAEFNPQAVTTYQTADAVVLREGTDTLRIQRDGMVSFHSSENSPSRYQAASLREKDLQLKAEELLDRMIGEDCGEAVLACRRIETLDDGRTELTFGYLLSGIQVQSGENGWAARFTFREGDLTDYEICLRKYETAEGTCAVLPQRQAMAAAEAMGQRGRELQLCYRGNSEGRVTAGWAVRETM